MLSRVYSTCYDQSAYTKFELSHTPALAKPLRLRLRLVFRLNVYLVLYQKTRAPGSPGLSDGVVCVALVVNLLR